MISVVRITDDFYDVKKVRITDINGKVWEGRIKYINCAPDYDPDEEALFIDVGKELGVEILGQEMKSIEVLD